MGKAVLEVMNPRARLPEMPLIGLSAERPADLKGLRVGFVWHKHMFERYFNALGEELKARYPGLSYLHIADTFFYHDVPQEIADSIDIWVSGIRTTGGDTPEFCAELEKIGKPGVMMTCADLYLQQKRAIEATGVPCVRQLAVPSYGLFSTSENDPEGLEKLAVEHADAIVEALTRPLTDAEKNPKPLDYDYSNRFFEGEDYDEAYELYQQYCVDNELGDGLPVTPPTPEAVKKMLTGTSRAPEEVVGYFTPRNGIATVEKIAINAVMAGAKPEYLPVIITIVECCMDSQIDFFHIATGSLASTPLIVVNGPIAKEIGMNGAMGYLGPGYRANSTIGRALELCMINLGWGFPKTEAPFQGQPQRYSNLIFCENEEDSPWESYAVQRGFSPEDSTVAIDECTKTDRLGPGGGMRYRSLEESLQLMADMTHGMYGSIMPESKVKGLNMAMDQGAKHGIKEAIDISFCEFAVYPSFAKQLAEAGFTKQSLAQWLCDQHRLPWDEFSDRQKAGYLELAKSGRMPGLSVDDCKPGGTVPTMNPEHIAIFVAGAFAGQTTAFYGGGASVMVSEEEVKGMVIKKITGATLTKAGR